jgi:hypothetical protein
MPERTLRDARTVFDYEDSVDLDAEFASALGGDAVTIQQDARGRRREIADWGGDELFGGRVPRRRFARTGAPDDGHAEPPHAGAQSRRPRGRFARDERPVVSSADEGAVGRSPDERRVARPAHTRRTGGSADTRPSGRSVDERRAGRSADAPHAGPRERAVDHATEPDPTPTAPATAAAVLERAAPALARAPRAPAGERRTVRIGGTGAADPFPLPPARRRPPRPVHERVGARPDRAAMWAFALCLVLLLVAILTATGLG